MFPFSEKILSELEEFDRLKQQRFAPGQQVIVTGNGGQSLSSAISKGYHDLKVSKTYTVIKEEVFHLKNNLYKDEGRLYRIGEYNGKGHSQNVFAFDLQPVPVPQKTMASLYCDLPDI